ncbi:hypothetical protein ACLOJK_021330 [Asimina triloba]
MPRGKWSDGVTGWHFRYLRQILGQLRCQASIKPDGLEHLLHHCPALLLTPAMLAFAALALLLCAAGHLTSAFTDAFGPLARPNSKRGQSRGVSSSFPAHGCSLKRIRTFTNRSFIIYISVVGGFVGGWVLVFYCSDRCKQLDVFVKPLHRRIYGLLRNGNFEYGPKAWELNGTVVMGQRSIPEWEISGPVEYIESGHKQGDMLLVVPEGAYAVRLGNEASIKQTGVKVARGMYYSLTFSAARTCAQEERLNVSVAPDSGLLPMQTLYSSNGWDSYAWAFQADYDEVEVVIHNPGVEDDPACGPLIDAVAIKALYPPKPTNKNLLKNGNFEEGPYVFPNTSMGVLIPPNIEDDHSPLPGWMIESLKAVKYIDSEHFAVPEGKRAIELVAGKESAIAQVARTIAGKVYALTFSVGDASNSCQGSMIVEAFAGKETVKVPYESKGKGGFKRAVLKFTGVSSRTRIMFYSTFYTMRSDDFSSLCGPVIDDVKLLSLRRPLLG